MSAWFPLLQWLRGFVPQPLGIHQRERARVALGVGLGLLIAGAGSHWLGGTATAAWLAAPLGASAVLVFGLPASPLAQPWPVLAGNTVSALVGVACVHWLPWPVLALPLASALAVIAMMALRCLHPPGGAAALLPVLGGIGDWHFALHPVLLNSLLLVVAALLYNRATGRRYPHPAAPAAAKPGAQDVGARFTDADLDAALERYDQLLDVPRDDLRGLLETAEAQAQQRRLSRLRCADIMSRHPAAVDDGTALHEAWALLHERRVKALPVLDRRRHVVGIVTLADFMRAAGLAGLRGGDDPLLRLLRSTPGPSSDKPEVVGQIMTREVRVASTERTLAELLPLLSATGHHHIPVIDSQGRLQGMVTQTDVISALLREGPQPR